ncbi:MAG: hypothetical protein M1833_002639 [Piccolia ochrophora]|nr:MAG: hypothetical protein M1833_002639 [Piccolia ochrophora]
MSPQNARPRHSSVPEDDLLNAEADLYKARGRNNKRLKSTFEDIFDKYSHDFEDVGDEIDLRTGEVVVDNGHLQEMTHESDPGNKVGKILQSFSTSQGGDGNFSRGQLDAQDPLGSLDAATLETPNGDGTSPPNANKPMPSEDVILAQFGQDLGPRVLQYVAQLQRADIPHVDPKWWAPTLPNDVSKDMPPPTLTSKIVEHVPASTPGEGSLWALPERKVRSPNANNTPKASKTEPSPKRTPVADTILLTQVLGVEEDPSSTLREETQAASQSRPVPGVGLHSARHVVGRAEAANRPISKCGAAGFRCNKPFCLTCE